MRYTLFFTSSSLPFSLLPSLLLLPAPCSCSCSLLPAPCSLLPAPCSLLPAPCSACSLLPAPCSLKTRNLYLTSHRSAICYQFLTIIDLRKYFYPITVKIY
ncbi:hypothetical protein [Moorena producens]|uniref:hypothetical protein n=1 Tax=Moorena producens TaxID=1155739 RepID=UPI0011EA6122|nr:hypothetical protein [Moorena producens]